MASRSVEKKAFCLLKKDSTKNKKLFSQISRNSLFSKELCE